MGDVVQVGAHGGGGVVGVAVVEIIDGIGHWTALEAAGAVTDLLVKFL